MFEDLTANNMDHTLILILGYNTGGAVRRILWFLDTAIQGDSRLASLKSCSHRNSMSSHGGNPRTCIGRYSSSFGCWS